MGLFLPFIAGVLAFHAFSYAPLLVTLALLAGASWLLKRKLRFPLMVLLLGVAFAFLRALPAETPTQGMVLEPGHQREATVSGYFTSSASIEFGGLRYQEFRVLGGKRPPVAGALESPGALEQGTIIIWSTGEGFPAGVRFELHVMLRAAEQRLNPGQRERGLSAELISVRERGEKLMSPLAVIARMRQELHGYFQRSFEPDVAALVSAMTIGGRSELSGSASEGFRRTGLAHMLSISGAHYGFLAMLLYAIFYRLIVRLPMGLFSWVAERVSPRGAAAALTLPFLLLYLGLSGATAPSGRAFVMIGLFLLGLMLGARGNWYRFLTAAAFVLVLLEPGVMFTLSFVLSFLAVLFIGLIVKEGLEPEVLPAGIVAEPEEPDWRVRLRKYLLLPVLITLAATAGVAPVSAYYFHSFSLISPLANLVVAPLAGFVLVPVSLLGSALYLGTGHFLVDGVVETAAESVLGMNVWLARPDWVSVRVPPFPVGLILVYYAGVLPWLMVRQRRALLWLMLLPIGAVVIFGAVSALSPRGMSVTFLDVGRGDAAVAEYPDGRVIVIDTGVSGGEVDGYMRFLGRKRVEALVLTHKHMDHAGGLGRLLRNLEVREVWDNGHIEETEGLEKAVRHLVRGDRVEFGPQGSKYSILVLHPYDGYYDMQGRGNVRDNDLSLVLRLESPELSVLMASDVQAEAIEDLSHIPIKWLRADVVKLPHHGRDADDTDWLAELTGAGVAVATTSDRGDLEKLSSLGIKRVYAPPINGAVKVSAAQKGRVEVKSYAEWAPRRVAGLGGLGLRDEAHNLAWLMRTW